ncbi:MAG: hypothetical protein ACLPX5_10265, partial [Dissulfurispiraceae bacterium]
LIDMTDGAFSTSYIDKSLQTLTGLTKSYKNAIYQVIHRLKISNKIKKFGNKDGWYTRIEGESEEIEWWNADTTPLPIKYPLGIEELALTYKKNIQIIAGDQNAGKTAYLLNFALLNYERSKVNYFSSEMEGQELKARFEKFEIPLHTWRNISFQKRTDNFVDVIKPDEINIIDYLEMTDEFYRIAGYLKDIFERLNDGICFVAIQKDSKKEFGRGGTMGLEKPRLYLNLAGGRPYNTLRIVKAKAWKDEEDNPNGKWRQFSLVKGYKLIPAKDQYFWQNPKED